MSKTLKEETIAGLQQEGKYDQSDFGNYEQQRRSKKHCGTSCCIAGHIVAAAARLGRKLPKKSELESKYDPITCKYIEPAKSALEAKGLKFDDNETAQAARLVWARAYGVKSANELDFYSEGPELRQYDMMHTPPSAAITHLNRVAAIK